MSEVVYELKVGMTCGGCSGAITRILNKVDGISDVKCDLETLQVFVTGVEGLDIVELLAKWVSIIRLFNGLYAVFT
jgi:copper chaperone CopZ